MGAVSLDGEVHLERIKPSERKKFGGFFIRGYLCTPFAKTGKTV